MKINTEEIVDYLHGYFAIPGIAKKFAMLNHPPIALRNITEFVAEAIDVVEKLVIDIGEVKQGGEKRDAIVKFLDDSVKMGRIGEMFDGLIIGKLVDGIVGVLNDPIRKLVTPKEE